MTCPLTLDSGPAELNIVIYRGLDGLIEIEVTDEENNDLPFDFTGGSFKAEMRVGQANTSDLILDLNAAVYGLPTDGVFRPVDVDEVATAAITQVDGDYYWDCLYTDATGVTLPWLTGIATLATTRTEP